MALGLNLAKGSVMKLHNLAAGSFLKLGSWPSETRFVQPRANKVPSNVSTKASSMRKFLDNRLTIEELSLIVSSAALIAASGPETKAMAAACGRYAKVNMKVVTPTLMVRVCVSFETRGFHNSRWKMKYKIPYGL